MIAGRREWQRVIENAATFQGPLIASADKVFCELPSCNCPKSALPPKADIRRGGRHVRKEPILLQKSFWGGERKFLEPLMRFIRAAM